MNVFNYTVSFNPTPPPGEPHITVGPTPPPPGRLPAPPFPVTITDPITLFTFALSAPNPSAAFLSYPVQWLTGPPTAPATLPDVPPPWFLVHRFDPQQFAFWDFNSSPTPTTHTFYLLVYYEGTVYSGDPVIINDPPMGPPD